MIIISNHKNFSNFTTGVMTYYEDFQRVVAPYLEGDGELLFWHKGKYRANKKCTQILHTPNSSQFKRLFMSKISFITHYERLVKVAKRYKVKANYVPMSIDLSQIPKKIYIKRQGIVYFGNLFHAKSKTYNLLKEEGLDFDTISHMKDHSDALYAVSRYEFGIGVGRAALEMLAMGLKVIVAGRNYAGAITNENFNTHHKSNCNSDVLIKQINLKEDLDKAEVLTDLSKLNMKTYIPDYLRIICG
jgi:hypothetical protein